MKNKKYAIIIALVAVLSFVLITIGVTYSFFSYIGIGTSENAIENGSITFHYDETTQKGRGISLVDALPLSAQEEASFMESTTQGNIFDFNITANTTSTVEMPYYITARVKDGSDLDSSLVKVYLTKVSGNTETAVLNPTVFSTLDNFVPVSGNLNEKLLYTETVPVNTTNFNQNYRLRMWLGSNANYTQVPDKCEYSDGTTTTDVTTTFGTQTLCEAEGTGYTWVPAHYPINNKTFTVTVNVYSNGTIYEEPEPAAPQAKDMILDGRTVVTNLTDSAYETAATTNNDDKIYKATTTLGDTYFFRGDITTNVVEFAGKLWRIVRINEDGTIRIVLDTSMDSTIHYFNKSAGNVMFMYYSNSGDQGDNSYTNVKYAVDQWYNTNIASNDTYVSRIATGNYFCEAAKVNYSSQYFGGSATLEEYTTYTPTFECDEDGNGYQYVNAPVALLTYDEMMFAGAKYGTMNQSFYLYKQALNNNPNNEFSWWTMSPAGFYLGNIAYEWHVTQYGALNNIFVKSSTGGRLRPVVNLEADVPMHKDPTTGHYIVD